MIGKGKRHVHLKSESDHGPSGYDRFMGIVFTVISVFLLLILFFWLMGALIWQRNIVIYLFAVVAVYLGLEGCFRIVKRYPLLAPYPGVWRGLYRGILWFCVGLFTVVQCFIFSGMAESREAPESPVVIVLGAHIRGRVPSIALRNRLNLAADYAKTYPDAQVIVCGGQGSNEVCPEAHVMKDYLLEAGVEDSRIQMDDLSANTYENLFNAFQLMDSPKQDVVIVSSDYHLYRAQRVAKRIGFEGEVHLLGAPIHITLRPFSHVREFCSILFEWFFPRTA